MRIQTFYFSNVKVFLPYLAKLSLKPCFVNNMSLSYTKFYNNRSYIFLDQIWFQEEDLFVTEIDASLWFSK